VTEMSHKTREVSMLTEHYLEDVRSKALRAERALPARIPRGRLQELLASVSAAGADVEVLCMYCCGQLRCCHWHDPV